MADMTEMEMPIPDNTLPMMSGQGPYGSVEMGGMFTTVKVRAGLAANDYSDPGWYKAPAGTVAREWNGGELDTKKAPDAAVTPGDAEMKVQKPTGHGGHH